MLGLHCYSRAFPHCKVGATLYCGAWASRWGGFSCCWGWSLGHESFSSCGTQAQYLQRTGSIIVVDGLRCSVAYGIISDQGSNLCPLHWQTDSYPLCHQRSLHHILYFAYCCLLVSVNFFGNIHCYICTTFPLWIVCSYPLIFFFFNVVCGLLCRAQALGTWASVVTACGLSSCGLSYLLFLKCLASNTFHTLIWIK